jgi:hypothetical protein
VVQRSEIAARPGPIVTNNVHDVRVLRSTAAARPLGFESLALRHRIAPRRRVAGWDVGSRERAVAGLLGQMESLPITQLVDLDGAAQVESVFLEQRHQHVSHLRRQFGMLQLGEGHAAEHGHGSAQGQTRHADDPGKADAVSDAP